jgi:hypothetical protein
MYLSCILKDFFKESKSIENGSINKNKCSVEEEAWRR